mgnify:CR=1 FL=1
MCKRFVPKQKKVVSRIGGNLYMVSVSAELRYLMFGCSSP